MAAVLESVPVKTSRCFGCKNLYSLSELVAREGVLVCRRHCAGREEVFEVDGATVEVIG